MKKIKNLGFFSLAVFTCQLMAATCTFDLNKSCALVTDLLNDRSSNGLPYFAPTNFDHRISGEINVYDASMVKRTESSLILYANLISSGFWRSGEIMTRSYLTSPPWNAPYPSEVWTTKKANHGYLEVMAKLPKCTASMDGKCQNATNPVNYNRGLWPAIWMMPTYGDNWPQNGEIDIMEAYPSYINFDTTTAALHFNGNDPRCGGSDCVGQGYWLTPAKFPELAYNKSHTWGFEWEKDAQSTSGGYVISGYVDNIKLWGPLRTDTLPADGAKAMQRGFNDPEGGFYLIVNLAIGGPYAGAPDNQMQNASMEVQAMRFYQVKNAPPTAACSAPINLSAFYTQDKKNIILNWAAPSDGSKVITYQVKDWQKKLIWQGNMQTWTDKTLPGITGKFTYFLSSVCSNKTSNDFQYIVTIPDVAQCHPPINISSTYTTDKKNISLKWNPPSTGLLISSYHVRNWQKQVIWQGNQLTWVDGSLPGKAGTFSYFLNSVCNSTQSTLISKDVIIN